MDACEGMWLTKLLARLFDCEIESIVVHCDNQSHIGIFDNPLFHDRTKHIDIKYHFLRDWCSEGNHSVGVHIDRGAGGRHFH